jgi:flavin reductase (DIM6/NTAB) family NADH-FMN oxidoreductase RutF
MDVTALFKLGYGLYVIGTEVDGQLSGCTANSVMQITSDPVQIVVGLIKANYTNEMIHKSGKLTVSILDQSAEMDLIANFGFQSSRTADKFHTSGQPFVVDGQQVPYLSEHTSAVLSAKVVNTVDCGTHTLFLCEVVDAQVLSKEEPMSYAYYHSDVKNKKKAESAAPAEQWKCSICGHVHDGALPEDFVCPLCKQPAKVFQKVEAPKESWKCSICGHVHEGPLPEDFVCPLCKQPAKVFVKQ